MRRSASLLAALALLAVAPSAFGAGTAVEDRTCTGTSSWSYSPVTAIMSVAYTQTACYAVDEGVNTATPGFGWLPTTRSNTIGYYHQYAVVPPLNCGSGPLAAAMTYDDGHTWLGAGAVTSAGVHMSFVTRDGSVQASPVVDTVFATTSNPTGSHPSICSTVPWTAQGTTVWHYVAKTA